MRENTGTFLGNAQLLSHDNSKKPTFQWIARFVGCQWLLYNGRKKFKFFSYFTKICLKFFWFFRKKIADFRTFPVFNC